MQAGGQHELTSLFRPRSVAILGVSDNPGKQGSTVLRNLFENWFSGEVYPVHPTLTEVCGHACVPDPAALPAGVDVAFLSLPASITVEAIEALAKAGVKNAIIGSAGYAEGGDAEGVARQEALSTLARQGGISIVGPNCNGIYSAHANTSIGFNTGHGRKIAAGGLAILSHSGALFDVMASQLEKLGGGLSLFVSAGNEAHLSVLDYLEYAIADPDTRAIALLLDALPSAERFRALARTARDAGKPIVVLKLGLSDRGAEAATAHSSRVVGDASAYRAFFAACGVPMVSTIEGLITAGRLLERYGWRSGGLAGFSTSGAGAALIADVADRNGVAVPLYSEAVAEAVGESRRYQRVGNPTDIGSLTGMTALPTLVDRIFAEPQVGVFLAMMHSIPASGRSHIIQAFAAAAEAHDIPVLILTPGGLPSAEAAEYAAAGFVFSDATEPLFEAVAALLTPAPEYSDTNVAPQALPELDSGDHLDEPASLALLARFGVPVAPTVEVGDVEAAVAAAERLGYPVALKGVGIAHKTEAGLVRLGLENADAVRAEFQSLSMRQAIVQRQCKGDLEVMVGVTRSGDVGLVLTAALGGVFVEALRQTVTWALPVSRQGLEPALATSAIGRILASDRWKHAHSKHALIDALMAIQSFALAAGDRLEAAEINPLLLGEDGAVAVDGLVVPTGGRT